jgi:acyl-coenzyme A thioesterase PaaI-like protein
MWWTIEVVNRSRRLSVIETRMLNRGTGKLCAMVTGSWMIVNRELG